MAKRVVVVASGLTEQHALPRLLSDLGDQGITVDVRIPPRNRSLSVDSANSLILSAWYESAASNPDKFVVLLDVDGQSPDQVIPDFQNRLQNVLRPVLTSRVLYCYAQWHLEAWFFADSANLRRYLGGRSLGSVDVSRPDEIQNPKNHLRNLLEGRLYTATVSGKIAESLDTRTISSRSPSFSGFREAIQNGPSC